MKLASNSMGVLASLALAVAGCATSGNNPDPGPFVESARLEIIGADHPTIEEGSEHVLEVRYLEADGTPISEGVVSFVLEGTTAGASLIASSAVTDAEGRARTTIRAGAPGVFDVVATAPLANAPAVATITVQEMRFGGVTYRVDYRGTRDVRQAEVALFANTSCATLTRSVPIPQATQVAALRTDRTMEPVQRHVPMAVYALGIDARDQVAAEGCSDVVVTGPTANTQIVLDDVAMLFGGTYQIEERFDVTEGFSPELDMLFETMSGLSTDPAAFVVDFVAEYEGTPGFLRTALESGTVRNIVSGLLRDAIADVHVPGYVTDVLDLGADFDGAFSGMTLVGELSFSEPDEFGVTTGRHSVRRIKFPLDGAFVERNVRADANVQVTVGPTITLAEHELNIAFGTLAEMLLNNVLLPRLPGAPGNTREFVEGLLDCSAIAASVGSGVMEDLVESVCDVAVVAVADEMESYVTGLFEYDVLHLQGTADLRDNDRDYDSDTIVNGQSRARWTGESGEMNFMGTMTGTRLGDSTGRRHPVRERMRELL